MQQFVIEGGHPLNGTITAGGNKNAALKMLPACLLTDEPVILHNMPDIGDVRTLIDIMRQLGVQIDWLDANTLRVHARKARSATNVDAALARKLRASIVLAGPLLARCGRVYLPSPGGDAIGERRLDMHVFALRKLGATSTFNGAFTMQADQLTGADILLTEASVTATENAIMAAVLAQGTTVISNAASEPHVQDLCNMLVGMGAQIDGIGSNRLTIQGVERLHGGEARVGADYMEVGSFIGAAVMTGGEITIQQADPQYLDMIALVFERLGVHWETARRRCLCPGASAADDCARSRQPHPDHQGAALARFPAGPDEHRADGRHPERRSGAVPRLDVRKPLLLHRQTDAHGRADHALRSASRAGAGTDRA